MGIAIKTAVIAGVLFLGSLPSILAQTAPSQCEILTKDGIADTKMTMTSDEIASSYRRWFCDKHFESSGQAESYNVNGALPLQGLPVKLGFSANRDNWSTWRDETCSDERRDIWAKSDFVQNLKHLNVELAQVIAKCIADSGDGLLVWIQRASDVKFKVIAKYTSKLTTAPPVKVTLSLDKDAKCDGSLVARIKAPNQYEWRCHRVKGTTDVIQIGVISPDIIPTWGNDLVVPAIISSIAPHSQQAWPIFPTRSMITRCSTRGKSSQRAPDDACFGDRPVTLRGSEFEKGIIWTQPYEGSNGNSEAVLTVPAGSPRQFKFTVGDYYMGDDCRKDLHKKGMLMYVYVDGVKKWEASLDIHGGQDVFSGNVPLLPGAKEVQLVGNTGNGPVDCDDAVWVNVRFDQ